MAKSILTTNNEQCAHGCGQPARFITDTGNLICCKSSNSCPALKKKNSEGIKRHHAEFFEKHAINKKKLDYANMPDESKDRMAHNREKYFPEFSLNGKGKNHKKALLQERGHRCEKCGLTEWMGKPITIELEHDDGDHRNNERSNLKLLCPNCHSQTETWKGKNAINKKTRDYVSDEDFIKALEKTINVRRAIIRLGMSMGAGNYERAYDLLFKYKIVQKEK